MFKEPIVIPDDPETPVPFLMRFAEKPNGGMVAAHGGGQTYMGTTPDSGGESGDYEDDDA
ncbi:MAG: hypothetical protein ACYDH9_20225 [Limisphaerales bacterium]